MAKYTIEDTTLTNIADPIRALRGLTGTLTPEEMAANAEAVQTNVTNALAALVEKGVTLPDGAGSDELAELIRGIESGSGGYRIATGTHTTTTDTTYSGAAVFEHNSAFVPKMFIMLPENEINYTSSVYKLIFYIIIVISLGASQSSVYRFTCVRSKSSNASDIAHSSNSYATSSSTVAVTKKNWNSQTVVIYTISTSYPPTICAGDVYRWIAVEDWEGDL